MIFRNKNKPRERFYLLPGQGGRNYRNKQRLFLRWAAAVALVFGGVLTFFMWWFSQPRH